MAIAKPKFPIDHLTGVLGHIDKTRGIAGGLSINLSQNSPTTTLGIKTSASKTRTQAQSDQACVYRDCDVVWNAMLINKQWFVGPYWHFLFRVGPDPTSTYHQWMSICLRKGEYRYLFIENAYVTRFTAHNNTGTAWNGKQAILKNIPVKTASGYDVNPQIVTLWNQSITDISYYVSAVGEITVDLPTMAPNETVFINVYSYGDY